MKQSLSSIISRQQVDRILPPVPWLHRVCVWTGIAVLSWALFLIFLGGLVFWMEVLGGMR